MAQPGPADQQPPTPPDAGPPIDPAAIDAAGLADAIRDLPIGAHSVALAGLVGGLVLWALGRRFVRPGFALVGVVLGAALGFFLVASVPLLDPLPIPAPYVGLGLGALLGLLLSVLLFRVVMAASTALIMALMGVLVAAIYLDLRPTEQGPEAPLTTEELRLDGPAEAEQEADPEGSAQDADPFWTGWGDDEDDAATPDEQPAPEDEPDGAGDEPGQAERTAHRATAKTRRFLRALGDELSALWETLPEQSQLVVALSAALGGALGALSGLGAPRRAAGAVTAMLGAAMWIPCLVWLAHARDLPGREHLHGRGPLDWAVIWLVAAGVGIVIQWTALRAGKAGDEEE